jgi:hypothetical protein
VNIINIRARSTFFSILIEVSLIKSTENSLIIREKEKTPLPLPHDFFDIKVGRNFYPFFCDFLLLPLVETYQEKRTKTSGFLNYHG